MELLLTKQPSGALAPYDEEQADKLAKIKAGAVVRADIAQMRNVKFHRKFFALINFLFGIWEEGMPVVEYRGNAIKPNKRRFRKDLIILTGRHEATFNIRGEMRLEAHSIAFGRMSEEEFEKLFSDVIDVALNRVLNRPDLTEERIRDYCDQVLRYS